MADEVGVGAATGTPLGVEAGVVYPMGNTELQALLVTVTVLGNRKSVNVSKLHSIT